MRAAWRHCVVLGVANAALPFWLIAWGEQYIDSGLAAVVQASVPIFNALIVLKVLPHERLSRTRALGLAIGIIGVAVVTGIIRAAAGGDRGRARSRPLVALLRERRGLRPARRVRHRRPGFAAGSMLVGGLILFPIALFQLPGSVPSLRRSGRRSRSRCSAPRSRS